MARRLSAQEAAERAAAHDDVAPIDRLQALMELHHRLSRPVVPGEMVALEGGLVQEL